MLGLNEVPWLRLGSWYAMGEVKSLSRSLDLEGSGRQDEESDVRRGLSGALSTKEFGTEDSLVCGSYRVRWVK